MIMARRKRSRYPGLSRPPNSPHWQYRFTVNGQRVSVSTEETDLDKAWDERREQWKIAGHIVRTTNVTQTAMGKDGLWTTVVSAAVFCG